MGDCKDCDCKGDCSSKPISLPNTTEGRPVERRELSSFLTTKPQEEGDSTPLSHPCTCSHSIRLPRYTCIPCIQSFVQAVSTEETEKWVAMLKNMGKCVATARLQTEIENKKRKELENE